MSLILPNLTSASDFVDKHKPIVMRRHITEHSLTGNEDWKGQDNIRVVCRFRPPNRRELAFSKKKNVPDQPPKFETEQTIHLQRHIANPHMQINVASIKNKPFKCTLDEILKPTTTQKQVFYLVGQPMILSSLEGFNSTIFAYGQSGSGKTYTVKLFFIDHSLSNILSNNDNNNNNEQMFGPENSSNVDEFGLVPRCFIYLFQKLNKSLSQNGGDLQDFKVKMELIQIYKRDLLDLLNPKSKAKLVIKTDFRNDSVFVQNLRSIDIKTVEEAFAVLTEAQSNRIVAGHKLNASSSRSHMLVMVTIVQRLIDGSVRLSKLNFGDLAGSEDLTKALGKNPDPDRRQEAIAINSSLSALTTAISYLSKGKKPGYRDSPLTHILKDSLGGNSKTVMFVACSPHIYNRNETIRALRFAACAKKVKNRAKKNEEKSTDALRKRIKELELQVAKLQAELVEARGKQKIFKRAITRMQGNDGNQPILDNKKSLSVAPASPIKPGPIPSIRNTVSNETTEPPSPQLMSHQVSQSNASVFGNMIKIQHSAAEEWSGSDEDVMSDNEDAAEAEAILKEEGGEEELNYMSEISDLRRKLEDAIQSNSILNAEIISKNIELEQCNNKISQLIEEAEDAQKQVSVVKRKLSYVPDEITSPGGHRINEPNGVTSDVPDFGADDDFIDGSIDSSDDQKDDGMDDIPPIPIPSKSKTVVTFASPEQHAEQERQKRKKRPRIIDNDGLPDGQPQLSDNESTASVADGYAKRDSTFSFSMGNNTMLQYLMDLQQNLQTQQQEMRELTQSVRTASTRASQFRESFRHIAANSSKIAHINAYSYDSESDEDDESDDDTDGTEALIEREKQIEKALNRNLKKKSGFCSGFSCFFGKSEEENSEELLDETSMLVEEYLKTHVRSQMKKEKSKKQRKKERKEQKKRNKKRRELMENQRIDTSYNFDNEVLSVLTDSPTRSALDDFGQGQSGPVHLSLGSGPSQGSGLNIDDAELYDDLNDENNKKGQRSKSSSLGVKNYAILVDNYGDSKKDLGKDNDDQQKDKNNVKTKPVKGQVI